MTPGGSSDLISVTTAVYVWSEIWRARKNGSVSGWGDEADAVSREYDLVSPSRENLWDLLI